MRRYDGHKEELSLSTISTEMPKYLEAIQEAMFQRAKKTFDERVVKVEKWEDVVPTLDAKNAIVIPWCEGSQCEDDIKAKSARMYVSRAPRFRFLWLPADPLRPQLTRRRGAGRKGALGRRQVALHPL